MTHIKGWCPGALRPMESGDGWVVRVRPNGGRLSAAQVVGIADAARDFGNGRIDLTGRANVQLRGVTPDTHRPLIDALRHLGLIDDDIAAETRRNIIVTPFADTDTDRIAAELAAALRICDLTLPAKFGFAVDTGAAPVLTQTPADIRIERSDAGLILRADGMARGAAYRGADDAIALARWFLEQGGVTDGRGRMAALTARVQPPADLIPRAGVAPPGPGPTPQGDLVAFEFGQTDADTLRALGAMRVTPWRMVLVEHAPDHPGLIRDPADPRLRVMACTGAPGCPQAHAATRPLARTLAPLIADGDILHLSGCAKGCGWPARADVTLTATPQGWDLIRQGRAGDPPVMRDLSPDQLPEVL
ncbi:precorrin-3B synthase [Paracoccus sp. (in: a-proteobacteria)]|uniref:precorrin-3B synthase n=1 Tax=Paracoccus sp. TaxID=267 RepID=UPI0026DF9C6C|nr:precorrin-3B synthase [Paracoccus sp. (in: a-proteobacteria)]MDO5648584.1 precorrin-3B synthase [Paracoccus sp. (in: a-proteobacteria)]